VGQKGRWRGEREKSKKIFCPPSLSDLWNMGQLDFHCDKFCVSWIVGAFCIKDAEPGSWSTLRLVVLHVCVFWFGWGRQQKHHMAAPPPAGLWRRMEGNRQKPVGRDKGSLTEQQTKGTGTATIQIRGIHNTKRQTAESNCHRPLPLRAPKPWLTYRPAATPHQNPAWEHMVWNTRLCLARWGQPAWLCLFLDSSEN